MFDQRVDITGDFDSIAAADIQILRPYAGGFVCRRILP
jgi:hypothetical protein